MASAAPAGLDLKTCMGQLGRAAREAGRTLARADSGRKNIALAEIAGAIGGARSAILKANARDLAAATRNRLADALLDRLELSTQRVDAMAEGLRQIAALPDPVGEITNLRFQSSGIQVGRMRVPLGVIGIIYESRPNVTADAAGLCLKSGNAAILRGGSEALQSNIAIAAAIRAGLESAGLPSTAVQVLETIDRAAVGEMLRMPEWIDIIVPRGGKGLIERVSRESLIPVIKHLDGNCHVYIDAHADRDKAIRVAVNAKTRRYGVCGAMESLLVAATIAADVLPELARELDTLGVELRGCDQSPGAGSVNGFRVRRGLAYRVPGPNSVDQDRARAGRGDRPYQRVRVPSHRLDHNRGSLSQPAVPHRGGLEFGHGEHLDPVRRRV